jgi:short subunit dehydrogenase
MVATAVSALGRIDVAHNNAGVPGPYRPLWEYGEDEFAAVLAVDLVGVWRCLTFEARHMVGRRAGSIVNTSSMLGLAGMADNAAYTAAKHGVHGLTRPAALERSGSPRPPTRPARSSRSTAGTPPDDHAARCSATGGRQRSRITSVTGRAQHTRVSPSTGGSTGSGA